MDQVPLMIFQGESFDSHPDLKTFKSIFMDLFRGPPSQERVDLKGLQHVITFTSHMDPNTGKCQVFMRVYAIVLKKAQEGSTHLPRVELEEMGPRFDFAVQRVTYANAEMLRQATKVPKEVKPKKEKNIEHSEMGDKFGRIHMEKQDLNKLETRKMKGLKRVKKAAAIALASQLAQEQQETEEQ
jgi:ribosome production factor 2